MTGKLRPDEMLRRLDLITERRAQARARRREKATSQRADNRARGRRTDEGGGARVPRRDDADGAPDRSG